MQLKNSHSYKWKMEKKNAQVLINKKTELNPIKSNNNTSGHVIYFQSYEIDCCAISL